MFGRDTMLMAPRSSAAASSRPPRRRRRHQARRHLRPRRQIRQIVQRRRVQRRDASSPRTPASPSATSRSRTRPARAGPSQVRQGRLLADHDDGFAWETRSESRPGVPEHQVRDHRHVVDLPNVQSIVFKERGGLVRRRHDRRRNVEDRQGRLRRRHGHSADLGVRCGYAQGVKYASGGKDEVFANMTGTTPAAGTIPSRAASSPSRRSTAAPTSSTPPRARPARAC